MKQIGLLALATALTACATINEPRPSASPNSSSGTIAVTQEEFYFFCLAETAAKAVQHTYVFDACARWHRLK